LREGAGSETERGEGLRASGGGERGVSPGEAEHQAGEEGEHGVGFGRDFAVEEAFGALCGFLPGEAAGGNEVVLRGEVARGGGGRGSDGQEGALEGDGVGQVVAEAECGRKAVRREKDKVMRGWGDGGAAQLPAEEINAHRNLQQEVARVVEQRWLQSRELSGARGGRERGFSQGLVCRTEET
jgi:hypothetical protein